MVNHFLQFERWTTRLSMLAAMAMLIISVSLGFYQVVTRFFWTRPQLGLKLSLAPL